MRPETARVRDALGYTLVVEMKDLFAKVKIFEGGWTALADPQGILVIGYRNALLAGQRGH